MKKDNKWIYIALLLLIATIFSFLTIYAFGEHRGANISISAKSAVLYQPETKKIIFEKDADKRLPMASTTKIMTALIALDNCKLDEIVQIDDRSVGIEGSSAYLTAGEALTMEELLYALLLQSANDSAVAIAYYIGGSIDAFAGIMNEKAASLGLSNTHFTNPHGLDDNDHYTTASDLAIIAAEAIRNNKFKEIVSTYKKSFTNGEKTRTYVNHNKLLRLYDGCIGVKTGFTKKSGRCLVGAAEKDGLTFISVTLNAPSDWDDHSSLLNYGFSSLERITFADAMDHIYKLPVIDGDQSHISVVNTEGASIITERTEREIQEHVRLTRYAIAPIHKGDILGEIIYTVDGKEAARIPLVATKDVTGNDKNNLIQKILSIFN